jgi:hypothetical protein
MVSYDEVRGEHGHTIIAAGPIPTNDAPFLEGAGRGGHRLAQRCQQVLPVAEGTETKR